jgi:hypothetical protein
MFLGAMLGGSTYKYEQPTSNSTSIDGKVDFNAGLLWGYDFGLLAGQVELLLTGDNGESKYNGPGYSYKNEFSAMRLQIPIMLKLDFHISRLMFQPQAGFYFNVELGDMDVEYEDTYSQKVETTVDYSPPLFGIMFGGALGVRIGRGYLFMDIRYALSLGETEIEIPLRGSVEVFRHAAMFNLGYQYYFKGKQ